jgi:hypothetical protein
MDPIMERAALHEHVTRLIVHSRVVEFQNAKYSAVSRVVPVWRKPSSRSPSLSTKICAVHIDLPTAHHTSRPIPWRFYEVLGIGRPCRECRQI